MDDPSADHRSSHSQAGTQRIPGTAPMLKRRRAAPTAPPHPHPHHPPTLGAIPFRTVSTDATDPMVDSQTLQSQAHTDGTLHADETRTNGMVEEEGLEGNHSSVGAAAKQSTR